MDRSIDSKKESPNEVGWRDKTLVRAIKDIMFFAEIFPKKYQNEFMEHLMVINQQNLSNKNSKARMHMGEVDYNYTSARAEDTKGTKARLNPKKAKQEKLNRIYWSDEYLIVLED